MNTQNPTFPFYGKTQTDAIFRFDSKYGGTCVNESWFWKIGSKWSEVSCFDKSYIIPLAEQEIKDNNLPELKQMNTTINPETGLAVTFPLLAKYNHSDLVVEFVSECEGTVVVPSPYYKIGHHSKTWQTYTDHYLWTILAAEPASNKNSVTFPIRAKHTKSDLVVEFVSEKSGKVIVPNPGWSNSSMLAAGEVVNCWGSCFDSSLWTILAAEPASNENKPKNNKQMNNTPFVLPEKWLIRTLNPVFSAEIQKQLFKLGCIWGDEKVTVQYTDSPVLYSDEKKYFYRMADLDDLLYYNNYTEITIEQLFSLSPAPKEIEFRLAGYKGAATADSIKVGCQEMTMESYKEMRKEIEEYRKPKNVSQKFKDSATSIEFAPHYIEIKGKDFTQSWNWSAWDEMVDKLNKKLNVLNK